MSTLTHSPLTAWDRVARLLLGGLLIGLVMSFAPVVPAWLALLATYPVLTAIMAWDPLYAAADALHRPSHHWMHKPLTGSH